MRSRRGGGLGRAVFVGLALVGLAHPAMPEVGETSSFDYLYIEANEGGSSGGHTAIRFGAHVYHFQNRESLLVLDRERSGDFLFDYALLNNRTIHVSEIGVSQEIETRLADRFLERYRAQAAQLEVLAALRRDSELLERADSPTVSVRGYGYFAREDAPANERSAFLERLRDRIRDRHGDAFSQTRRRSLEEALVAFEQEDPADWPVVLPDSAYDYPVFAQPWSNRLADLAAGLAALEVLEEARSLDPASVNAPHGEAFRLTETERVAIASLAERLEAELIDLVDSQREDWGQALLVGMARLAAFEASLETDYFVFLDSFPDEHGVIGVETLRGRSEVVPSMLEETLGQLVAARRYLARAEEPDELAWERVEERLARHHELTRAVAGEHALRLARGHLVPARGASYPLPALRLSVGESSLADRSAGLRRVRARERAYAARLHTLHRYGLITQNCVTEIFDTVNTELGDSPESSRRALGGIVEGQGSLGFIPFVSADQVNTRYRVLARYTLPSYRKTRLRSMRGASPPFWLALRESNTFTSRAYQRADRDSFFVFFSEDPVWLRPIFGAVNLAAALGQTVWGIAKLPVDRGKTFVSGLKGAFVSMPELAFANIRKGSNDWVAPEFRSLELQSMDPAPEPRRRIQGFSRGLPPPRKLGALARLALNSTSGPTPTPTPSTTRATSAGDSR